jgi:Spy/CpxP family protein refolding chaperone
MNAHTSLWLALPLALFTVTGCNNAAPANQAPEAAGAGTAAEALGPAPAHHKHHAHGAVAMMFKAAKSLDLGADQRASIQSLSSQLRADRVTMQAPQQALHAALVAGVRAGNVDMARLAPLQAAVDAAHQEHAAREAAALNGLYAALTPAQRQELVANVRAKPSQRHGEWRGEHEGASAEPGAQRAQRLTTQLGLDSAQQQSLAAITATDARPAPAEMAARRDARKARMDALLTAFASDSFDATKLDFGGRNPGLEKGHAAFLAKLVPILRADQREALAASMSAHKG